MTREPQQDGRVTLDAMFAEARATPPDPGAELMARVMADALDARAARPPAPRQRPRGWLAGLWRAVVAAFGGAGPVTGMATAAAAGLLIGFAAPAPLANLMPAALSGQAEAVDLDLIPDLLALLEPVAEM